MNQPTTRCCRKCYEGHPSKRDQCANRDCPCHTTTTNTSQNSNGLVLGHTKLTNNGTPHVCGEFAVHKTPLDKSVNICTNCGLPVDPPHTKHEEEWEKEFYDKFDFFECSAVSESTIVDWIKNNFIPNSKVREVIEGMEKDAINVFTTAVLLKVKQALLGE